MDDLISRKALLKHFNALQNLLDEYCECFKNASGELSTEWHCVESIVENAPTVDAVPVVRCRECRHSVEKPPMLEGVVHCVMWDAYTVCDGYCHHGTRRGDDAAD